MYHGHHVALPMCLPRGMVLGQPPIHPLVRNVFWGGGAPPNEPPPLFLVKWRFPACKHCPRGEAAKWFWSLRKGWRGGGGCPPCLNTATPSLSLGADSHRTAEGGSRTTQAPPRVTVEGNDAADCPPAVGLRCTRLTAAGVCVARAHGLVFARGWALNLGSSDRGRSRARGAGARALQMQPTAKTGVSSSGSEHVLRGGQGAATRWPIRGPCGRVSTVPLSGSRSPLNCGGRVEKHPSASACDCRRQRCGGLGGGAGTVRRESFPVLRNTSLPPRRVCCTAWGPSRCPNAR